MHTHAHIGRVRFAGGSGLMGWIQASSFDPPWRDPLIFITHSPTPKAS